jgi:YidC/Oxa1 family membrane protein insertase
MGTIFHIVLYQPLFNALVFLYQSVAFHDLGIAIILLTVIIRAILYPLFYKSLKHQTALQRIQPAIKQIQESHKDNRERQAQALLALYREHKINPFSGFLLILVQLPILWALYRVFLDGFSPESFVDLYSFISVPEAANNLFLGLINIGTPNIIIVVLAALAQYFQGKLGLARVKKAEGEPTAAERMGRQMVFIAPVITIIILFSLPAAIGIYWLTTSVFSIFQQIVVNKNIEKEQKIRGTVSNPNKENN